MKLQITTLFLLLAAVFTFQSEKAEATDYYHTAHRGQIMQYLNRSHEIKSDVVKELKKDFQETELVGLDDTMNSFEVNELVAEIMEAESYQ